MVQAPSLPCRCYRTALDGKGPYRLVLLDSIMHLVILVEVLCLWLAGVSAFPFSDGKPSLLPRETALQRRSDPPPAAPRTPDEWDAQYVRASRAVKNAYRNDPALRARALRRMGLPLNLPVGRPARRMGPTR